MDVVVLTKEDVEAFKWPESCKLYPITSSAYLAVTKFMQELEENEEIYKYDTA